MRIIDKNESSFDGSINISSNIKANKNTLIGKFDFRDLMYIVVAVCVGIIIISVLVVLLPSTNIFIIFLILAIFEIPIISIGFMNIYNMKLIDYIKMIDKSDNKSYRKQIIKYKKDSEYYIIPLVLNFTDFREVLERIKVIIFNIKKYISIENQYEIKVLKNKIILLIKIKENLFVDYYGLFMFLRTNRDILYLSYDEIRMYKSYISSLRFVDKKYTNKHIEIFNKEKEKIDIFGKKDSKNKIIKKMNYYLTNEIIDKKDNKFLKVIKIILYKHPFDIDVINQLKDYSEITIYIDLKEEKFDISNISLIDTFIMIDGDIEDIKEKYMIINSIFKKHRILYKEINEEKVRDSLDFIMENRY